MSPPISQHVKTTCNTGKKDYAERIPVHKHHTAISMGERNKEAKRLSSQNGKRCAVCCRGVETYF